MRAMLILGLVAVIACSSESVTSPAAQAITPAKRSASVALPSVSDPTVEPLFVCGPDYPADGGVIEGWCGTVKVLWLQPYAKHQWFFTIRVPGTDAPGPVPPEEDFTDHRFGVLRSPKPIIRHDRVYQFNSLDVEIVGGRRYLEVSVRDNQPVNWGVFQTR
jgi:hypothetical protein